MQQILFYNNGGEKNMSKKGMIIRVIAVLFIVSLVVATPVLAISTNFPTANGTGITKIETSVQRIWKTVLTIVQILAFAAVIFAGLRYMFASADQKADIKKGLGMLTIGAVLVFAASTVVKFVVNAANQIL